ncbi:hypothetical protein [Nocardia rhizosphaerae]|uniref:Uncharacterized protein n=1 Tax=Nocardia rhizosphaerae TaxID=1691571 RepID=A0ABV8L0V0_9NOCA
MKFRISAQSNDLTVMFEPGGALLNLPLNSYIDIEWTPPVSGYEDEVGEVQHLENFVAIWQPNGWGRRVTLESGEEFDTMC